MNESQLQAAQSSEMSAVTLTYMGVGVVLLALLIIILLYKKMPANKDTSGDSFGVTVKRLMKRRHYSWGVLAQFFYVGAQIGVWSYTIRYVMKSLGLVDATTDNIIPEQVTLFIQNHPFWSTLWQFDTTTTAENIGNSFYLTSLILFMISRFIFTALMRYMQPGILLAFAATGAVAASLVAIFATGMTGVIGLVMISFFMSLMFPTIYGIALEGMTEGESKVGGSFLVMAILGGAILTAVQGFLSTTFSSINVSYWIPLLCFVIVGAYGLLAKNDERNITVHN